MVYLRELYTCWHNKDESDGKTNRFHLILGGFREASAHRARGRGCRHAVRTRREWPASNSGVQRRLRLQKCKAFGVSLLFVPAGIFVHVCRRCQRADRAGGFHVGLIFCNFSIKRKVEDHNYLID